MTLHSLDRVRAGKGRRHIVLKNSGVEEISLTSFARFRTAHPDTIMKPGISSKLVCFAVALMMNGLIFAGVNYLLNGKMRQDASWRSLAYTRASAVAHNVR
jgi:hypothetical protein